MPLIDNAQRLLLQTWLGEERRRAQKVGQALALKVAAQLQAPAHAEDGVLELFAPVAPSSQGARTLVMSKHNAATLQLSSSPQTVVAGVINGMKPRPPKPACYVGFITANVILLLQVITRVAGPKTWHASALTLVVWLVSWAAWLLQIYRQERILGTAWDGGMLAGLVRPGGRLRHLATSLIKRKPGQSGLSSELGVASIVASNALAVTLIIGLVMLLAGSWDAQRRMDVALTLWPATGLIWGLVMIGFDRALRAVT